jgi:hypothetical protein
LIEGGERNRCKHGAGHENGVKLDHCSCSSVEARCFDEEKVSEA